MKSRFKMGRILSWVPMILAVMGCSKTAPDQTGQGSQGLVDSVEMVADSVIGSVNSSFNDAEQSGTYSMNSHSLFELLLQPAYASNNCDVTRFSPFLGSASCTGSGNTVYSTFNQCTAGPNQLLTLNGTVTLTFNTSGVCQDWINGGGFSATGSLVRTAPSFTVAGPFGGVIAISTNPKLTYRDVAVGLVGGGEKTSFSNGMLSQIDILGVHRSFIYPGGQSGFSHSIRSVQPLLVSGSRAAGTRQVTGGVVEVYHNRSLYTASASFSTTDPLTWGLANCCHPTSGHFDVDLSGSIGGHYTVSFNGTCGQAQWTGANNQGHRISIYSCE